jgi:hypothetical protein
VSELGSEPPQPSPPPVEETVSEQQLVRGFYWLYRAYCRVLGASVEANQTDFRDLGKAWLELARKVPGIRMLLAIAGPLFTLTDLVDKMARAWEVRSRFRQPFKPPNWRKQPQQGQVEPDDGAAGAP